MHIDARELPNNSTIQGDVCIVGAGAAGVSMALDWIGKSHKVILLEGGGFEYEEQVQDLYHGETTGQKYYPLKSSRLHYFGGTTGHWGGMCAPYDEIDFQKRDWVPHSGWPISKKDLDPYYARANKKLQLGPYEYGVKYWQEQMANMKPFPFDDNIFRSKMWQFSDARYNTLYRDEITEADNIELYTYANVVELTPNENVSTVKEAIVKNHAGRTHTVMADHFILACGAIQNARLLLASNSQAPNGLGNDHDLVGRYFMEHIEIYPSELWMFEAFDSALYDQYKDIFANPAAELGFTDEIQQKEAILNGTFALVPLSFGQYEKPAMLLWEDEDPREASKNFFGSLREAFKKGQQVEGVVARSYELKTRLEQSPNPNSRVTIGTEKDTLGVPRANLHWELNELDWRSICKMHEMIALEAGRTGIGRVRYREFIRDPSKINWPEGTSGGWHHMGTTRMHEDPQSGVVDANCQVQGINNLYVAGSACYPTAGAANPTLTLIALSLRLSDYVMSKVS